MRLTPFLTGLTLTSTTLYVTLLSHQRSRTRQAALLHQSALLLESHKDMPHSNAKTAAAMENTRDMREVRGGTIRPVESMDARDRTWGVADAGWVERWKDGWNRGIEGLGKGLLEGDWRRET